MTRSSKAILELHNLRSDILKGSLVLIERYEDFGRKRIQYKYFKGNEAIGKVLEEFSSMSCRDFRRWKRAFRL